MGGPGELFILPDELQLKTHVRQARYKYDKFIYNCMCQCELMIG